MCKNCCYLNADNICIIGQCINKKKKTIIIIERINRETDKKE